MSSSITSTDPPKGWKGTGLVPLSSASFTNGKRLGSFTSYLYFTVVKPTAAIGDASTVETGKPFLRAGPIGACLVPAGLALIQHPTIQLLGSAA